MEDGGPVFQHASDVKPDSLRVCNGRTLLFYDLKHDGHVRRPQEPLPIAGYRHGRPRISSSRWHYYAILIDDLPNKTTSKIVHQQWYDIKILFSTYVLVSSQYTIAVALPSSQPTDMYIVQSPRGTSLSILPFSPSKLTYDMHTSHEVYSHPHEHIVCATLTPTTRPPMIGHIICEVFAGWNAPMV